MSTLDRFRERMSYVPTRMQSKIVTTFTVLFVVGGLVLDHVLTGFAHQVYWAVTFMLFGAAVVLVFQQRRR